MAKIALQIVLNMQTTAPNTLVDKWSLKIPAVLHTLRRDRLSDSFNDSL